MLGMDDIVGAVANIGGKLIDRLWPDPAQAAAAKLELLKMQQSGEALRLMKRMDILSLKVLDLSLVLQKQSMTYTTMGYRTSWNLYL